MITTIPRKPKFKPNCQTYGTYTSPRTNIRFTTWRTKTIPCYACVERLNVPIVVGSIVGSPCRTATLIGICVMDQRIMACVTAICSPGARLADRITSMGTVYTPISIITMALRVETFSSPITRVEAGDFHAQNMAIRAHHLSLEARDLGVGRASVEVAVYIVISYVDDRLIRFTLHPVATRMQVRDLSVRYIGTLYTARVKAKVFTIVAVVDLEVTISAVTVPER